MRKARYTIRNDRAPSMLGRASRPSPLPCAPGKYREMCDFVTARKRTRAAKSLICAERQDKFPNRPNRDLIRPDRDLIQSNWEAPAIGRSSLPVVALTTVAMLRSIFGAPGRRRAGLCRSSRARPSHTGSRQIRLSRGRGHRGFGLGWARLQHSRSTTAVISIRSTRICNACASFAANDPSHKRVTGSKSRKHHPGPPRILQSARLKRGRVVRSRARPI
jgi:hypothetical protein